MASGEWQGALFSTPYDSVSTLPHSLHAITVCNQISYSVPSQRLEPSVHLSCRLLYLTLETITASNAVESRIFQTNDAHPLAASSLLYLFAVSPGLISRNVIVGKLIQQGLGCIGTINAVPQHASAV